MQGGPMKPLLARWNMERKNLSQESPRRLSAKLGKGTEMKKVARQLGMAAAESDKDSGFSG